ncbi:MAG: FAD-dependent oxidoreductase [Xanthobacteraceae bacterium]|nr:FAD-dependent oxidoreductase [Xanthobacteraceae bacterium]
MSVKAVPAGGFAATVPVIVVGAGAAGICAALSAHENGVEVVVLERDSVPRGSTALSAGLIPAAGTRFQKALGIGDSPALFASDIRRKAHGEVDAAIIKTVAQAAGPTVQWLADRYGLPFSVVHDFDYPGHSARRMHGLPSRSGVELIDRLRQAADETAIPIILNATVSALYAEAGSRIRGVEITRPDGTRDSLGCEALILACNGYGGAAELVARYIPEMRDAMYFGHPGNRGDAVQWGQALGAKLLHMSGYQGHGSVAHPHGVLITWAAIMEGGFQVNANGERFSDESRGYSEQAAVVLAQPGGITFDIFDERIAVVARQFADFQQAERCGAVVEAATVGQLAERLSLPAAALEQSSAEVEQAKDAGTRDRFGRSFAGSLPLSAPFKAVRVTGALFHTQGGLAVDSAARVVSVGGDPIPNLFAAGGAAAGVSGSHASGYLSGNGLLTATVLGRLAGASAAAVVKRSE